MGASETQIKTRRWPAPNPSGIGVVCRLNDQWARLILRQMADVHHETVFFSGHVQGVGFRFSVLQVAREFDVAGFVSNLPDGRVHVEVEGREQDVAAFIDAVQEKMHGYVRKLDRSTKRRAGQFSGFVIR